MINRFKSFFIDIFSFSFASFQSDVYTLHFHLVIERQEEILSPNCVHKQKSKRKVFRFKLFGDHLVGFYFVL